MHFLRIYFLSICCLLFATSTAQCPDIVIAGDVINENPCGIGPNGSIHLSISGGLEPYTISWTNGDTDQDSIIDLVAGSYGVTVIDSNNCTAVAGFQVLLTDTMTYQDLSIYPSCDGDSGTGIISVLGGNPPYEYLWSNGSQDSTASNLPVGVHSITVTDQSNCTITMEVEIITNPDLEVFPVVSNPMCFSDFGSVSLFILGGAPPYEIDWLGNDSTAVAPGTYNVSVTDASNCNKLVAYHILSEASIEVDLSLELQNCNTNTYSVQTSITGGNSPYILDWFGLDTNAVIAGSYPYEVMDSLGCVFTDTLIIDSVDSLSIELTFGMLGCAEDSTLANMEIEGGMAPYEIVWSGTDSDSLVSVVYSGINWVEVSDARGCVLRDSFDVVSPDLFTVEFEITPTNCNMINGSIITHVIGGSGNSNVYYNGNAMDTIMTGLEEGFYSFSIVDHNGCEMDTTVEVPAVPHFYLDSFEIVSNTCNGDSNASINLRFEGIEGVLDLIWNTGDTTAFIDSLTAGQYTLIASDSTGCSFDTTFIVEVVDPVYISSVVAYNPCDSLEEFIRIVPGGGTPPYEIYWEIDGSSDSTLYIDHIDTYTVTVTDSSGCSTTAIIQAVGDAVGGEYCFKIPNAFSPNGDGYNDEWIISGLEIHPNNTLKVFDRWGMKVYETSNYDSDWVGDNDGNELPMGSYFYILDLGDGVHIFNGSISIKR